MTHTIATQDSDADDKIPSEADEVVNPQDVVTAMMPRLRRSVRVRTHPCT